MINGPGWTITKNKRNKGMGQSSEIKDPAVAVCFAQIQGSINGIKDSYEGVIGQLETLNLAVRELTKLTSEYSGNSKAIELIWKELEKRDERWDLRAETLRERNDQTRKSVDKILWFSSGVSAVSMLLIGLLIWIGNGEIDKNHTDAIKTDDRLDKIEIYLASPRNSSYQR